MTAIQQISAEVRALVDRLTAVSIGQTITYGELSQVIGRDVQSIRAKSTALRARVVANRESGAIFVTITKVGWKRIAPNEAAQLGSHARRSIRRRAGATSNLMTNAIRRANDLAPAEQRAVNAELAALGLIKHLARDKPTEAMGDEKRVAPPAVAADAFLRHIGAK